MISKSIRSYFHFGMCWRYIADARAGFPLGPSSGSERKQLRYALSRLFEEIERLDLSVTSRVAKPLREFSERLSELGDDDRLSAADAVKLSKIVDAVEPALLAELDGFRTFVVTPKRLDVAKLLGDTSSLVSTRAWAQLPEIAQYDMSEAGKCTAFERPRAAAFHLMRATEATLREYYCAVVKRGRTPQLMWGPMINHMRGRRDSSRHGALLDHLDHIRASFRNPTQHPHMRYTMDEVQDLWGVCVDVLNRMARRLPTSS